MRPSTGLRRSGNNHAHNYTFFRKEQMVYDMGLLMAVVSQAKTRLPITQSNKLQWNLIVKAAQRPHEFNLHSKVALIVKHGV